MARYTVPTVRWEYRNGEQKISETIPALIFVEAKAKPSSIESVMDLEAVLPGGGGDKAGDVVVWAATEGENIRWLLGGEPQNIRKFFKRLHMLHKRGDLSDIRSVKMKQESNPAV